MRDLSRSDLEIAFASLQAAARDHRRVSGWTHDFYRYPARFSPSFAAAAIQQFSEPGDLIADPYMGGGTAVVEAMVAGRKILGNDLNSLAAFVTAVKTTPLSANEIAGILDWAEVVPHLKFTIQKAELEPYIDALQTRNLSIPRARFIKKVVAASLATIEVLPTANSQRFARCAVLRVTQWALDGRKQHTRLAEFREKLRSTLFSMLQAITAFDDRVKQTGGGRAILNLDAAELRTAPFFDDGRSADLVVTSPPYPGVHMLYHRWQVDGRRETNAPYWIAGCSDGKGASYYNFGDRRQGSSDRYFTTSLATLKAVRKIMTEGAYFVQLVAFNHPETQLPRYTQNMIEAGFSEVLMSGHERIWRTVPNRKWHATLRGPTHSSKEVVLVHRAS